VGVKFEWDAENEGHIARHNVTAEEVRPAYADPHAVTLETSIVAGEQREAVIGAAESGRILVAVFTERDGWIRIVTARRATRSEQQAYRSGR
jgi:uncharacterized DUF497 family protein